MTIRGSSVNHIACVFVYPQGCPLLVLCVPRDYALMSDPSPDLLSKSRIISSRILSMWNSTPFGRICGPMAAPNSSKRSPAECRSLRMLSTKGMTREPVTYRCRPHFCNTTCTEHDGPSAICHCPHFSPAACGGCIS